MAEDKIAQRWQARAEELLSEQTAEGNRKYKNVKLTPSGRGVMVKELLANKPGADQQWHLKEGQM